MTENEAYMMGQESFKAGITAPVLDKVFMSKLEWGEDSNKNHNMRMKMMKAWSRGWFAEHKTRTDAEWKELVEKKK